MEAWIAAVIMGLFLIVRGIRINEPVYIVMGSIWVIVDGSMLLGAFDFWRSLSTCIGGLFGLTPNTSFGIVYMLIPAWVMATILLTKAIERSDQIVKLIALLVFMVDNIHWIQQHGIMVPLLFMVIVLVMRQMGVIHLDDVHPNIPLYNDHLIKAKSLYIVPDFEGTTLDEYPQWCKSLKDTGKKLCMHGIKHTVGEGGGIAGDCEFSKPLSDEEIDRGIKIWENAFGEPVKCFKAPCFALHPENRNKLEARGIEIHGSDTLFTNKLCHRDWEPGNGSISEQIMSLPCYL